MRRSALVLFLILAGACGEEATSDRVAGNVELVSPNPPQPGQQFELQVDETKPRSSTWILSKNGRRIFSLGTSERSAPPHYFPIEGSSLDVLPVAITSPAETLVWPTGLDAGTYELCNADPDDLCITVTVE